MIEKQLTNENLRLKNNWLSKFQSQKLPTVQLFTTDGADKTGIFAFNAQ